MLLSLQEARPAVQFLFALRFVAGSVLGVAALPGPQDLGTLGYLTSLLGWVAAIVFVYVLNGVCDIDNDSVNGVGRPLSRGALSRPDAIRAAIGFALVAMLSAVHRGPWMILAVVVILALGCAYSLPPFRFCATPFGSIAVVVLGGFVTYIAGMLAVGGRPTPQLLALALAMSCWSGFVGAITKDFSDIDGDRAAGRGVLAVRIGERRLRATVASVAVAIGVLFCLAAQAIPLLSGAAAVVLGGGLLVAYSVLTTRHSDRRDTTRLPYRIHLGVQYLTHLTVLTAPA
ncbi:UbiA family prenyltransferase [Nocardia sp. 2]|uniref:UbiA family prenyltransferase n=1 Tax=Nocardia acididurans TaxID=2802282 RepID=A0ABS1MCD4_9NOCA|nr:UbiA family prenyltransferase [Nocardia acididurans]MBL1078320.1 UbiA family prenyltransferase [Nocardia acididurans]